MLSSDDCSGGQKPLLPINLLPALAAATFLEENNEGKLNLTSETRSKYQLQGLMGFSEIHNSDLVIYTKGL